MADARAELQELRRLESLESKAGGQPQPRIMPQAPSTGGQAFNRSAVASLLDNLGGIGQTVFNRLPDSIGMAANLVNGVPLAPPSQPQNINIPFPRSNEVFGVVQRGTEALTGGITGDFQVQENPWQQQQAITQSLEEEHPILSALGGAAGDGATLVMGRAPIRSALRRTFTNPTRATMTPGVLAEGRRILNSPYVSTFMRGIGRTGEASLEGAALAVLDNENADPVAAAGLAGGAQAAGSMLRTIGLTPGRLALTAATATVLFQMGRELTPGGRDFILESTEGAIQKMMVFGSLGVLASLGGAGRASGAASKNVPVFADAIRSMPRGMVQSLLTDFTKDEQEGTDYTERAALALARNPDAFTEQQQNTLERALTSTSQSFRDTVIRLSEDSDFLQTLEAVENKTDSQIFTSNINQALQADNEGTRPTQATRAAEGIGRHLPRESALRSTFQNSGPRTFISQFFNNESTFTKIMPKLGRRQRQDALETNLNQMITNSMQEVEGDRRVLNAEALKQRWSNLSEPVKKAYPEAVRNNVENFINQSLIAPEPFQILPPLLARSLMMPNGALSRKLAGLNQ